MHGDNLFQSPEGREHLSPRSVPKNHRTDPFYSPGDHHDSTETSPYTSALFSPDDMMQGNSHNNNIQFENVDWAARKNDIKNMKQQRTITPTKEIEGVETINLTPPMIQHQVPKPTHYSPPRVLTRQQSPIEKSGLGIQMYDAEKAEKEVALDEKRAWEPTQPPPSHYIPYKEFEDVELNKPSYARSQRSLPPYTQDNSSIPQVPAAAYYSGSATSSSSSSRLCSWLWIVYILIFLICFIGIPLAIFGGVYHWNFGKYRCVRSWGHWHQDSNSCTY